MHCLREVGYVARRPPSRTLLKKYCRRLTRGKILRLPGQWYAVGLSGRGATRPTSRRLHRRMLERKHQELDLIPPKDFAVAQKMALYFHGIRSIAHLTK